MENYVINVTEIASEQSYLNKLGDDRIVVDAVKFQNLNRPTVGEKGITTDGWWDGWRLNAGGLTPSGIYPGEEWKRPGWETSPIVLMDKYRDWVKTLAADVKWLLLDIENVPYSLMYPDKDDVKSVEKTHRLFRKLHLEAKKIRPDLKFSLYCEQGTMPHQFIGGYNWKKLHQENFNSENNVTYRKRANRLTYGFGAGGAQINSRGIFKANELISGVQYLYLNPNQDKSDIEREARWIAGTIKSFNSGYPSVYVSPVSHIPIVNDKGYYWNEPISPSLASFHGGTLRRAGFKGMIMWGYQSDSFSQLTNSNDPKMREAFRQEIYEKSWKPTLEAYYNAFL